MGILRLPFYGIIYGSYIVITIIVQCNNYEPLAIIIAVTYKALLPTCQHVVGTLWKTC